VYHAWQCENTELRINLLEFLGKKSRALAEALPTGAFERAEFIASGSRLVAQINPQRGVLVRSSLAGVAASKNDSSFGSRAASTPQLRQSALRWFEEQLELPGLFAATLQFADRTGPSHSRAANFGSDSLNLLRRSVMELFQVLKLQRFHARHARWLFENVAVESAVWPDGTSLAFVFSQRALELNLALVKERITAFLGMDKSAA
jgi:hypothetical protein